MKNPEIAPTEEQGIADGRWNAPRADGTPHNGLDIKSPLNSPLYSMFKGEVFAAVESKGDFGNYIIIKSNHEQEIIYVLYAHLNSIETYSGTISAGSLIGNTGDTGNARGTVPHVHIEVRKGVEQQSYNNAPDFNPENYMTTKFDSQGKPISSTICN